MKILLMIPAFLCIEQCVNAGVYNFTCPESIPAEEGDALTLQCCLEPRKDLSRTTVEVTRVGLDVRQDVHISRWGHHISDQQSARYRNRTTLDKPALTKGCINLTISSMNQSDSGSYECYVPTLKASCTTKVHVGPKKHQNVKRNESSTLLAPQDDVTKSAHHDVGKTVVIIISVVVPLLLVLVLILILFLKREKIKSCLQRLRGGKKDEEAGRDDVPEGNPLMDSGENLQLKVLNGA